MFKTLVTLLISSFHSVYKTKRVINKIWCSKYSVCTFDKALPYV